MNNSFQNYCSFKTKSSLYNSISQKTKGKDKPNLTDSSFGNTDTPKLYESNNQNSNNNNENSNKQDINNIYGAFKEKFQNDSNMLLNKGIKGTLNSANSKYHDNEEVNNYIIGLENNVHELMNKNSDLKKALDFSTQKISDFENMTKNQNNMEILENSFKQSTILLQNTKKQNEKLNEYVNELENKNKELNFELIENKQKLKRTEDLLMTIKEKFLSKTEETDKEMLNKLVEMTNEIDNISIKMKKTEFLKENLENKLGKIISNHETEMKLMMNYKNSEISIYKRLLEKFKNSEILGKRGSFNDKNEVFSSPRQNIVDREELNNNFNINSTFSYNGGYNNSAKNRYIGTTNQDLNEDNSSNVLDMKICLDKLSEVESKVDNLAMNKDYIENKNKIIIENEKLKLQNKNKDQTIYKLSSAIKILKKNLAEKAFKENKEIIAKYTDKLNKLKTDNDELMKEIEFYKKDNDKFKAQISECHELMDKKEKEYKNTIFEYKTKNIEYKSRIVTLKKKVKELHLIIEQNIKEKEKISSLCSQLNQNIALTTPSSKANMGLNMDFFNDDMPDNNYMPSNLKYKKMSLKTKGRNNNGNNALFIKDKSMDNAEKKMRNIDNYYEYIENLNDYSEQIKNGNSG